MMLRLAFLRQQSSAIPPETVRRKSNAFEQEMSYLSEIILMKNGFVFSWKAGDYHVVLERAAELPGGFLRRNQTFPALVSYACRGNTKNHTTRSLTSTAKTTVYAHHLA